MGEQTKPEAIPEVLTKEQLEGVSGGSFDIEQVLNVTQPIKPAVTINPFE